MFGCRAVAHVPDELRVKSVWTVKSTECIFIGYSETENLYELWDVVKEDVIRKRDVIFFEEELEHEMFEKSALPEGSRQLPMVPKNMPENETPLNPLPARQHVVSGPDGGSFGGGDERRGVRYNGG